MKKRIMHVLALAMAVVMVLSSGIPAIAADESAELTAFEQEFMNPDDDARPYVRWWIAPGRMDQVTVEEAIKTLAEGGYAGVELQSLELAKNCQINDDTWNETMEWILEAGIKYGVQIDFTIGQCWPIATPVITDPDDDRLEQKLWEGTADFAAAEGAMTYTADAFVYPEKPEAPPWWNPMWGSYGSGVDTERKINLVAVVAAKVLEDGTYDVNSFVSVPFDAETGAVEWTATEAGTYKIFYYCSQTTLSTAKYVSPSQYTVDHMSKEASEAVLSTWTKAFDENPELAALYKENAGSLFGDSFELASDLWSVAMLDEFEARRGYDLTKYLPAIMDNDMGEVGERVKNDYNETMTELVTENHMDVFREWAHEHGMTLRYQAYSSTGSLGFELTEPALASDIIEAEAYAMGNGNAPDTFRQLSGAVNMRGDSLYTAETSEMGQDAWQVSWTGTNTADGTEFSNPGFYYQAYRLFAAGVNKHVFHGTTYKMTDFEGLMFGGYSWPGYSAMAGMSYGNEWDDKTPMWENVDISVPALSRYQMVLQQGQADIDLAVFRSNYGKGETYADSTALELNGYTYDYVTESVLNLENAIVTDGVLAVDGPSYKALIIEPTAAGNVSQMTVDVMEKIVSYAKAGLPVVIVGEAPSEVKSFANCTDETSLMGEDMKISDVLIPKLQSYDNVKIAVDRAELVTVLAELGVTPDAQPETPVDVLHQHRATDEADFYYLFNNTSAEVAESVTLKGEGAPYLLDAWSGEVTPIAEYTVGEGTITIDIELTAEDAMMVALAGEGFCSADKADVYVTETDADAAVYEDADVAVRTTAAGDYKVTLSDDEEVTVTAEAAEAAITLGGWSMVLHQWTEGDEAYENVIVDTEVYDLTETGLVPWAEIDEALTNVVGVAEYTATFELEKGWAEGQGAYIDFAYYSDIARLIVNGTEVPMNQIAESTDIGEYLVAGENTVVVKVSSNAANVTQNRTQHVFGIVGDVVITPYTQTVVELATEEEPGEEVNPGEGSGGDVDPGEGSGEDVKPGEGSGEDVKPGTGEKPDDSKEPSESVDTGDHTNMGMWIAALVVAGAAIVVVLQKNRRYNR